MACEDKDSREAGVIARCGAVAVSEKEMSFRVSDGTDTVAGISLAVRAVESGT